MRRNFFTASTALSAAALAALGLLVSPSEVMSAPFAATSAKATSLAVTPQEKATIDYMRTRGITRFIMLNEKRGLLLSVQDGELIAAVPALSGINRGDDRAVVPGSTPARIFPLELTQNQAAPSSVMIFERDKSGVLYVIHRVFGGDSQHRSERLEGKAPFTNPGKDRRISSGCINLRSKDYDTVSAFAVAARQTILNKSGAPYMTASFLVVLPETMSPQATVKYLDHASPNN